MRYPALVLCATLSVVPGLLYAAEITPAEFASQAAGSDLFEIQSGELAMRQGATDKVKAFAKDIVKEHKQSSANLQKAAKEQGISVKPALSKELQEKLTALQSATGPTFDAAYLSTQMSVHTKSVELFGNFAEHGEGGPLKAYADQTLPTMRMHLIRLRGMTSGDATP